ncbi:unnamed protein product [Brassica oleracea]
MMLLPLPVITVLLLVCLPTALFLMLQQSPILKKMISSTYGNSLFKRHQALVLTLSFYTNALLPYFMMHPLSIASVESFDVDIKEQKVTVKGNVQPDAVLQTVSKTGKKSAFWDTEAETAKA